MQQGETIRFSVVIPVYNAAATIIHTLQSVLGQRMPAHEIIVVNDCSTDGTAALLLPFRDRITYISLEENRGPSYARNAGMRHASGTHIVLQDADDVWYPEKLEILKRVLSDNPAIRFLFHDYEIAGGAPVVQDQRILPVKFPFAKLLLRNRIATPCTVINRQHVLCFDEGMSHTEDYDLFLRIAWKTGVYHLPVVLTTLNRPVLSAGGQSSNRWKMRKGEMIAYLHLARLHPLFIVLVPFLISWALLKHLRKIVAG